MVHLLQNELSCWVMNRQQKSEQIGQQSFQQWPPIILDEQKKTKDHNAIQQSSLLFFSFKTTNSSGVIYNACKNHILQPTRVSILSTLYIDICS